jgi:hypothetical protein
MSRMDACDSLFAPAAKPPTTLILCANHDPKTNIKD